MSTNQWKIVRLKDISQKITKGTTPTTLGSAFVESGVNFIKAEAVTFDGTIEKEKFVYITEETHEKLKRSQLQEGDILFSMAGMVLGKTAVVPRELLPANTNQALALIRLDKEVALPKFVDYYMRQKSFFAYVNRSTGQSAQPNINLEEIGNLTIYLPDLPSQERIASILSSLDSKIELNRKTAATLEATAQALFKEWFVEYQFPGASGEVEEIAGTMVPRDWRIGRLGDVCELAYGKALKAETRVPGDYPVVGSSGVVDSHHEFLVKGPGIVVGRKGTIGETTWLHTHFFPIDTTFYIVDKLGVKGLYFHYFLLQEQDFKKIGSDSAVPGLNRNEAYSNFVMIPVQELVGRFNEIAKSIFDELNTLDQQTKTLAQLRDGLLPRLMRGEVGIS